MAKFDRKIKKLSKEFQVPESYHEKVDEILETIKEDSVIAPRKKPFAKAVIVVVVLCLIITGCLFFSNAEVAEASFLQIFKQTIMDFFGVSKDESEKMGIESEKITAVSKPDLIIELQEVVMDTQNIFAVVKITAPPNVEFKKGMTFDYYGFCEGTNYNANALVSGVRECTILEVMKNKSNVAIFVVNVGTNKQIEEGKNVTVFFQDLITGPYEDKPEILVEGIWSLSFFASYTNSKEITIKGTEDMKYSYSYATADIKKIKLLPLGLTLVSDVSKVDDETRNTTNTQIVIRLKMIDGKEIIVDSPNLEDDCLVKGSSVGYSEKKGHVYETYVGQFEKAIDINQVLGIYIADYYVPLKEYE